MTAIVDKYTIKNEKLDKRIKLTKEDKKEIEELHKLKALSIRGIARLYKVDKRLIQFVLYPERQKRNIQLRAERGGSTQYYNKDKNTIAMRKHRAYKKKLLGCNLLTKKP